MSEKTSTECTCKPPITTMHICAEQAARAVFLNDDEIRACIDRHFVAHPQEKSAIEALIEQSSLGTPEAKALREQTPTGTARAIVLASKYLGRAERAEAKVDEYDLAMGVARLDLARWKRRATIAEGRVARVKDVVDGVGGIVAGAVRATLSEPVTGETWPEEYDNQGNLKEADRG